MKKLIAIVLSLAMVLSVVVLPTAVTATAANATGNVAFEGFEGSNYWIQSVDSDHPITEISTDVARTGTHSWHVGYDGNQSWKSTFAYIGDVVSGKKYIVDYYVKFGDQFASSSGWGRFDISVTGSKGTVWPINQSAQIYRCANWFFADSNPEWKHFSYVFTAETTGALNATITTENPIHADFYVDDMTLTEVTDAMSVLTVSNTRNISTGSGTTNIYIAGEKGAAIDPIDIGAAGYTFGGLYTDDTCATSVTVFPQNDAEVYCNLDFIQNFENFSNTIYANSQTVEVVNSGKEGKGMSFSGDSFGWSLYAFNTGYTVAAGSEYLVEFDYKITGKPNNSFVVYPVVANSSNIWGSGASHTTSQWTLPAWQDPDGTWEHGAVTLSVPSTNDNKALWFNVRAGASGKSIGVTFDNVIIRKVNAGRKIVNTNNAYNGNKWNNVAVPQMLSLGAISYVPTHSGAVFGGWYTDSTLATPVTTITASTAEIYADWAEPAFVNDFEGTPKLINSNDNPASVSTEQAYGGTHSLKFEAVKSNYGTLGGAYIFDGAQANQIYKITFKYKVTEASNAGIHMRVLLANPSNVWSQLTPVDYNQRNFDVPKAVTDGWAEGLTVITTPSSLSDKTSIIINIQSDGPAGTATSGLVYFDDISVSKLAKTEALIDYNANGGTLSKTWEIVTKGSAISYTPSSFMAFTGWYSDAECTSQVTVANSTATVYAGWNTLSNSFEAGYASAETAKKYTVNTDASYVHSGSQSLHFNGNVAWTNHCVSVGVIEPGNAYIVDFWYYIPSTNEPTVNLSFQAITYAGDNAWPLASAVNYSDLDSQQVFSPADCGAAVYPIINWQHALFGSWQHGYFYIETDGDHTNYTTLGLNFIAPASGTAEVYIDDVTVTPVPDDKMVLYVKNAQADAGNHIIPIITEAGDPLTSSMVPGLGAAANGCAFLGFYADTDEDGDFETEITEVPYTGDVISAKFASPITITFNANYGVLPGSSTMQIGVGSQITNPPTPTRAGYIFTGWYTGWDFLESIDGVSFSEDATVYAGWKLNYSNEFNGELPTDAGIKEQFSITNGKLRFRGSVADGTGVYWTNYGIPVTEVKVGKTYVMSFDYKVNRENCSTSAIAVRPMFASSTNIWGNNGHQLTFTNFSTSEYDPDDSQARIRDWYSTEDNNGWLHEDVPFTVPEGNNGNWLWFTILSSGTQANPADFDIEFDNLTVREVGTYEKAVTIRNTYNFGGEFENRIVRIAELDSDIEDLIDFPLGTYRYDGAEVIGYTSDSALENLVDSVTDDLDFVYVKWEQVVTVTFNYNGEDHVQYLHQGDEVDYPEYTAPSGYNLVWSVDGTTVFDDSVVAEDTVITAYLFKYGDVNGDNVINVKDIARLAKKLADSEVIVTFGYDCNGNGVLDAADLTRLKKYIAGVGGTVLGE